MRVMQCVYHNSDIKLYEYIPTIFRPLYIKFEPLTLVRRIRYMYEYLKKGHYYVYYLKVADEFVGSCVIAPGGRRLKISTENDIVFGPNFIRKDYRGKGYGKILLNTAINHCRYHYVNAFGWISKKNIPSIKATEACGFTKCGELNIVGKTRKLVECEQGSFVIYKKKNG